MTTPEQWIRIISQMGENHRPDCCCDRCKKGTETFLVPSDIAAIQADAIRHSADILINDARRVDCEDGEKQ